MDIIPSQWEGLQGLFQEEDAEEDCIRADRDFIVFKEGTKWKLSSGSLYRMMSRPACK